MRRYILWLFTLAGCAMGSVASDPIDYSLVDIQRAVTTVIVVGIQPQNVSDRLYDTKYFRVPFNKKGEHLKKEDTVRAWSVIKVLGDRRPYTLEVVVHKEVREPSGQWSLEGTDQGIADQVIDQIQDFLVRHKDKNLIDHFRAF